MGYVAPAELLVRSTVGDEGRAPPGVADRGNLVGGSRHGQLGDSCGTRTDCVHRGAALDGVNMTDGRPPPQSKLQFLGHWTSLGHMEDSVRHYKPKNRESGPGP